MANRGQLTEDVRIRLSPSLLEAAREQAIKEDRSLSGLIRFALRKYLQEQKQS